MRHFNVNLRHKPHSLFPIPRFSNIHLGLRARNLTTLSLSLSLSLSSFSELTIVCRNDFITVSFSLQDYPKAEVGTAHLEDPSCKPHIGIDTVSFRFGLLNCGTNRTDSANDEYIDYSNTIHMIVGALSDSPDSNSSFVQRHRIVFPFKCSYKRKYLLSLSYNPKSSLMITNAGMYGNPGRGDVLES